MPVWADQQNIALGDLVVVLGARGTAAGLQALVVVVDADRQNLLCAFLTDYVLVEDLLDLMGLGKLVARTLGAVLKLLADDVITQFDAFVANEDRWTGDELANLVLTLAAKGAIQELSLIHI